MRILCFFAALITCPLALAGTFTVTNTSDTGAGSLRQAIIDANNNAGLDTIAFNIPGSGVHTITLGSSLPDITSPVIIDGYTQPGATPNTLAIGDNAHLLIRIDGGTIGTMLFLCNPSTCGGSGFSSDGSTIRGLCLVKSNNGAGLMIDTGSNNNRVAGNFLGVDTDGTTVVSNGAPITILSGASGNTVGGTSPADRNVIASNAGQTLTDVGGDNTLVQGSYFGVNAAGTAAIGSAQNGIIIETGGGSTIGGSATGAGNVINATNIGVQIAQGNLFFPLTNHTVQGNLIGTDATGTIALHTLSHGINLGSSANTTIGGSTAGAGNVIATAGGGIDIFNSPTGLVIQGNKIGTDITGTVSLGNSFCGIHVSESASTTGGLIGGLGAGQGNTIAFSGTNGISIANGNTGWAILGNSIHDNTGLGITLGGRCGDLTARPTPNDSCDSDTGPNNLQNYPVLTSVSSSGGITNITGTLNSAANTTYRVEFFGNDAIDPTGFGEGKTFVGFANVNTDANCTASFNVNLPQIAEGQRVTATATDPSGNTSEFSAALGQLLNISTRLRVQTGENVLIGGFIITGSDPKKVIIRGIGPSLSGTVSGFLANPTLELHAGSTTLATNDDWKINDQTGQSQQAEIEATTIPPTNDLESAIVKTLPAGSAGYTAVLRGKNNTTGIGVVEAYDLDQAANSKLANISTRGLVETGDQLLIGGFIAGNGLTKVIVRAIGPSLINSGVQGALQDPTLELHDGNGGTIATNDNWKVRSDGSSQRAEIEATTIPPTNDSESALVQTLAPGNYTAVVQGVNNTTGIAVVEVYALN